MQIFNRLWYLWRILFPAKCHVEHTYIPVDEVISGIERIIGYNGQPFIYTRNSLFHIVNIEILDITITIYDKNIGYMYMNNVINEDHIICLKIDSHHEILIENYMTYQTTPKILKNILTKKFNKKLTTHEINDLTNTIYDNLIDIIGI